MTMTRPIRILGLGAALCVLVLGAVSTADAADYYIDGERPNCALGSGAPGIISVGPGLLGLTETSYERVGPRQQLGGGWTRATFVCMAEGEPCGEERIELRITDAQIDLRRGGETFSGRRCPA